MLYLYALLVLSLAAILWAVWAIAKHVRTHAEDEQRGHDSVQPEAGETMRSPNVSVALNEGAGHKQQIL